MRPASRAEEELNDLVWSATMRAASRAEEELNDLVWSATMRPASRAEEEPNDLGVFGDDAACESGRIIGGGDGKTSN
jgi:hypothetical protein